MRSVHTVSIMFIIIISIGIYLNILNNNFTYDDGTTIVNNFFIKEFGNLPNLFNKSYFDLSSELSYRPVVTFTYFMDYALYDLRPWGYHLTNILLHAVNGVLLYILLSLIIYPTNVADDKHSIKLRLLSNPVLIIALLFVTNPILTEAVNAISYREDLLVFLFFMATLIIYIILKAADSLFAKTMLYLLSCFTYLLALFSKEMSVTLPLIVCCHCWLCPLEKKGHSRSTILNRYNVGYIIITSIYFYLRFFYIQNPREGYIPAPELSSRLVTVPWLLLSYLKLTIFPVSLTVDYVIHPVKSIYSLPFIVPFTIIFAIITLIFIGILRNRKIIFGILFTFITLLPVYNIIPTAHFLAERYLYVPSTGVAIFLGSIIYALYTSKRSRMWNNIVMIIFIFILTIFSISVVNRNYTWKDDYTLMRDTVQKMPYSFNAHNNLGYEYYKQRRLNEATHEFRIASRLKPDDSYTYMHLGNVYYEQNKLNEAMQQFLASIRLNPHNPISHNGLGCIYYKKGKLVEAIQEFQSALKADPQFVDAHFNLAFAYLMKGLKDEAISEFKMTLKLKPDHIRARQTLESLR